MKYKRKIFLINKPFQFRFSLYVCSWLFAISFVYPLVVYNLFEYFLHYMTLDPNGPTLEAIQGVKKDVIYLLVFFQLAFLALTFLISVFMSHRIAGPLFKLRSFFKMNGNGKLSPEVYFRKSDHFQEVAAEYNQMMNAIRTDLSKLQASLLDSTNELDSLIAGGTGDSAKLKKVVLNLHSAIDGIPK
jgi:methyl-accepting chemotaxis protein